LFLSNAELGVRQFKVVCLYNLLDLTRSPFMMTMKSGHECWRASANRRV